MNAGYFIAFEGPEGAGKSTQIAHLKVRLEQDGIALITSREPGGTQTGDAIRHVLLDPALTMTPLTEFLLYSASRAEHVATVIAPALAQNKVVITDRFAGASLAYQGYGRGVAFAFIEDLTHTITERLPDLTILLDIDVQQGLARIAQRQLDRLEQADISFHQRVRQGFLEQAHAPNWLTFAADQDEHLLAQHIYDAVTTRLYAKLKP
jgi:dTMP kinase